MSSISIAETEIAAALARGVRQCVLIGSGPQVGEALARSQNQALQVFAVDEEEPSSSAATFVRTEFASEALGTALEKTNFDKLKATLFVWIGGGYRTAEAALSSLAFIAALPSGSSVVFDYAERTSLSCRAQTALDALASRVSSPGGVKRFIQPQAVAAMLRSLGFQKIVDLMLEEPLLSGGHLVSASV